MKHYALLFFAALSIGLAFDGPEARSQEESDASDTTLYRVTSSRLRSSIEDGKRVLYLEGGVRIEHETTTITSVRGKHYPDESYIVLYDSVRVVDETAVMLSDIGEYFGGTNTVELEGHVRFNDRGWKARCNRAKYDRGTRIAVLTGDLSVADSTRTMYADTIVYDRNREIADATGKVVIVDDAEDYSLAGDHARFDRPRKRATVDVNPVLTFDLKSQEPGRVTSRIMNLDVDRKIGVAEDEVQMVKGETRAHCDTATIYDEEGRAELRGKPEAVNGSSSMSGNRMLMWYNEHEIDRVVLPEAGRLAQSPAADSPWREDSWIEGDSISIYLSDDRVDSVMIPRKARAMYYPVEGEANKVSNNYSTGNRMFFVFKDKELSRIRISGASTGLYKYVNLAPGETVDSLAAMIDSTLKYKNFARSHERVQYSGDRIEYFAENENVILRGRAFLKYQNSSLEAERIDFNSGLNLLEATGHPVLVEDEQRMYGTDMGYDLDTKGGVVIEGSTKYDQGYYQGDDIFKVGENVLKVYNSTYTTCDYTSPHYSFRANKMKVYVNDKIVSGPIVLYLGKMPIFYLPFMVNSLHHARSSGFLKPNLDIGIGSREGRFIQGLGYYWATNDYTDFLLTGDFNERQSVRLHLVNNYVVRYAVNGNLRLDFVRNFGDGTSAYERGVSTNEWVIESEHSQTFSPSASFTSHIKFVSSDEAQQSINEAEDITRFVDRRVYSSASFRKSWGGTSLSLSASRDQKLSVKLPTESRISSTLPSFSLNFPQRSLWFGSAHAKGQQSFWERGLGSIVFTPRITATRTSVESIARKYSKLTSGYNMSFSRQFSLGFIGINPSVGTGWSYVKLLDYKINEGYDTLYTARDRPSEKNEVTMNFGTSLGTKIYGTVYPRIGPLVGIRHTMTPSAQYRITPKLTAFQSRSQMVSWSLDNSIDLKVNRGGNEVRANDVFTWYLGGSYNPDLSVDEAFSDISSSSKLRIGNILTFNFNHRYSPYEGKILSSSFGADFNLNLKGALQYPATWSAPERERIAAAVGDEKVGQPKPGDGTGLDGGGGSAEPAGEGWSLTIGYNFSESETGSDRTAQSTARYSASAQLSRGWRLVASGYYNVDDRSFTQQSYSLQRDLHCWSAGFTHQRTAGDWRYYFHISIKAHPDIKYERGTRAVQSLF